MRLYASWTGTRRNLRCLRSNGWRLLMSPDTLARCAGKTAPRWADGTAAPYALDNGAWGCFQRGEPFDSDSFLWAYERVSEGADWIVAPDIVGKGQESLRLTKQWLPRLNHPRVLIAVQDGMKPQDIDDIMDEDSRGLFIGGSTEWKLKSLPMWGHYAQRRGLYMHVARVNTIGRLQTCRHFKADSIDGSSATRFAVNAAILPSVLKQTNLFGG